MGDRLIHSVSLKLVGWLNFYAKREGKEYLKLLYGMEVIVTNVVGIIIFLTISLLLGILVQSIAVLIGFNVIRRFASGVHAGNMTGCSLSSTLLFNITPWVLKGLTIHNLVVASVFGVILLLLFLYAPADTEAKPLVGKRKRARLRKCALIAGTLLLLGTLVIPDGNLKAFLTLGAVYEAIAILPITYMVLNKKYRNYLQYEKPINKGVASL